MKKTDVAVGIVFRGDGQVLIGQRLVGKPYAGWWEFPGGKFEPGEDAAEALARELDEELGVQVLESRPWVVREHAYEHAHVRLHFRRVIRWRGTVTSREGQAFVWRPPGAIDVAPLLPAAIAPIRWLGLPAMYAISNATELGVGPFLASLERRLRSDLRPHEARATALPATDSRPAESQPLTLMQLREPLMAPATFEALFDRTLAMMREGGARLLVSSRHPPRFWREAADATGGGVHLTARDLHAAAARAEDGKPAGRPQLALVGASCHGSGDLAAAGMIGADLAVLGPVKSTASHPGAAPMGWELFQKVIELTPVPVYALGGLGPEDIDTATRHGAHGISSQRAAWAASR
jgi:8-oxo-dGTP diphosphatase